MRKRFTYVILSVALIFASVTSISAQNVREEFKTNLKQGLGLLKEKKYDESISAISVAHDIAKEAGDQWAMAIGKSGMGYVSYRVRDYKASYINYLDALEQLEEADTTDLYNEMDILYHLALIHSKFNNYDESIKYRERALTAMKAYALKHPEDARRKKQMRLLVDMPYYLAGEYEKKGAHQTAGKILMDLWEKAENKEDIVTHAKVLNKLGIIKKNNGEYGAALEYFGLVATETDVPAKHQAIAYHNLAETYMVQGELDRAQNYYLIALDLKKELNKPRSTFITYLGLGELEYKRSNMQQAITFWETGLSVYDEVESEPELYSIYNWLQLAYMDIDLEKAKTFNQTYAQLNNFYVRNQTFQREEEAQKREALSMLIDQERQRRIDADQRQRFIRQFWPVFLGVALLVLFSMILGVRYYLALRANKLLSKSQLKLERAKEILRSADNDLD